MDNIVRRGSTVNAAMSYLQELILGLVATGNDQIGGRGCRHIIYYTSIVSNNTGVVAGVIVIQIKKIQRSQIRFELVTTANMRCPQCQKQKPIIKF